MLQIDHIYEFLYQELFKDFECWSLLNGVPNTDNVSISDISIFTHSSNSDQKIFFYDQEPFIIQLGTPYINLFAQDTRFILGKDRSLIPKDPRPKIIVTSEHSHDIDNYQDLNKIYYFFHGFAAVDWYRGYYALNYNKSIVKQYKYDFISFNRIINNDRSYRIYFVSLLKELGLLEKGLVSFNVTDNLFDDWQDEVADPQSKLSDRAKLHAEQYLIDIDKLIIDRSHIQGCASANIPRTIEGWWPNNDQPDTDAFWHVVTETVFYYDKLHLTEKIFKPIVSKQPFMLLAAPGNLAYLKSYGFKTFDSVIDESYDTIQDNDLRIEAVVKQLHWYCNLTPDEKTDIIQQLEPVIQHNFDHFYGEFRYIITQELLDNTKILFKEIDYDDSHINYTNIHHVLTH
jgi:hypothetical protein